MSKKKSVRMPYPVPRSAIVTLSGLHRLMNEAVVQDTIVMVQNTTLEMGECLMYLRECKRRFDNRGKGQREICGYKGWRDFVERGLGKSIRTIQRQLVEAVEPEKAEERRLKARNDRKQMVRLVPNQHAEPTGEQLGRETISIFVEPQPKREPQIIDVIVEPEPQMDEMESMRERHRKVMALEWFAWENTADVMEDGGNAEDFIPIFDQLKKIIESVDAGDQRYALANSVQYLVDEWIDKHYCK
jgi:hypothetical protein